MGALVFLSKFYTVNYVTTFTTVPTVTLVTTNATALIVGKVTTIDLYIPHATGHNRLL